MMELVFDLLTTQPLAAGQCKHYRFTETGGYIGRNNLCEWVLMDTTGHVSGQHAHITHQGGMYFIKDLSTNGTSFNGGQTYLAPGQLQRIKHGDVFGLAGFSIRARLEQPLQVRLEHVGLPQMAGSVIPDDAFIGLDVLHEAPAPLPELLFEDEPTRQEWVDVQHEHHAGFTPIDFEHLIAPQLIAEAQPALDSPPVPCTPINDGFWDAFGEELGVDVLALDLEAREALALNAAKLLKQCIAGMQQNVWTRNELKNELRLARTVAPGAEQDPFKSTHDARQALRLLLGAPVLHQPTAEQWVVRTFRDMQAHQVAMLSASRAVVRNSLEHFSPQQLVLRFEREGHKPLWTTAASHWRAFNRYHQALQQDDDWTERLLARDFAQVYDEQVRLICTLHNNPQG
ncbi:MULTISPECIES: type VI secretion system-associated FHA domain protein TagH [unclassified Pseudomonas]|uniref:type VI secretion system-associated FHA domain protein TagH n=1 Tax=unclassified Pseudomonas TaxID=196821 RepID=UPI00076DE938|nr:MULTISPECIES: type VI secretion system-associated FHA domain protein TagH [unclassified Pseudomonas]KVV03155.1 type VI secretion system FHA domain protein [Pseudomonas sp. TAD18]KVV05517.1 type VI secretion system FHA domain protein [Pseudomonas sp. TAA207]